MTAYGNWPLRTYAETVQKAAERDRLQAEVEALRGDNELMRTFIRKFIGAVCWDIDGGDVQGTAEEMGLIEPVTYDPDKHGEVEYAEPGDTIYTFAGPLVRSLHLLQEQGEKE